MASAEDFILEEFSKKNYAIIISTYEEDNLTLSHVFYGDTLDDAKNIAKSHTISDYFFASSINGKMQWKGKIIQLQNYSNASLNFLRVSSTNLDEFIQKLEQTAF